jgi:copper chaperone CopZ
MLPGTPRTFIGSTTFTVRGLVDDASRSAVVESVSEVDGVEAVTVDLDSGVITVRATRPVDRADVATAAQAAGFAVAP